jgi:hypothetical protein
MTNIIEIRLADGSEYVWNVSNPSQEQIDLLPLVMGALDRCNDTLVPIIEQSVGMTDDRALELLIEALVEREVDVDVFYGDTTDIAFFGNGEEGVSIVDGVVIPIYPADNADDLLETADRWGSLREDVTVTIADNDITLGASVREAINSFGDIEEVYQAVFEDNTEEFLVQGYTYNEQGRVVTFSRDLTVEGILNGSN